MMIERDKPLLYGFAAPAELLDDFGVRTGDRRHDDTRCAMLGQLAHLKMRGKADRSVSYSRRKEWWASPKADYFDRTPMSFATVSSAVYDFEAAGVIEHERAKPCRGGSGRQSRIRLRDDAAWPAIVPVKLVGPTVLLRDANKMPLPLPDTDLVRRVQRQMDRINDDLARITIGGPHVDGLVVNCGDGRRIWLEPRLRRIFNNGSFSQGGRAYGALQNVPKAIRATLTLNGAPVVTPDDGTDYKSLHIGLLYAEDGIDIPDSVDLYDIGTDRWPRPVIKVATNILINALRRQQALASICRELARDFRDPAADDTERGDIIARRRAWQLLMQRYGAEAADLIEAIEARHDRVAGAFGSGAGLRLQRIDSDMLLGVIDQLLRRGIPVWPIHDEILAPAAQAGQVREAMQAALLRVKNRLCGKTLRVTAFLAESCASQGFEVPHYGGDGALVVLCPDPDLSPSEANSFEKTGSAISQSSHVKYGGLVPIDVGPEFATFAGGVLPERLREAVLHEIGARGLTQEKLAAYLGLSRPQLTNALRGRFGLGREPAARLRQLMAG